MDYENNTSMNGFEDIFYLEDFFFIKKNAIKENTDLVEKTFQELYKYVSYN